VSVLDFPRIHFRGLCECHVPTGNNNNLGVVDLGTNTVYYQGKKADETLPAEDFYRFMEGHTLKYNARGEWDDQGEFSKAAGWDYNGNTRLIWEARITSTQLTLGDSDPHDLLVGRAVNMWGHYNPYLGTTFNQPRMVDNDPSSNWTTQIFAGQLTFGRDAASVTKPNLFLSSISCVQHARWLTFEHIRELTPHCNNAEFAGAAPVPVRRRQGYGPVRVVGGNRRLASGAGLPYRPAPPRGAGAGRAVRALQHGNDDGPKPSHLSGHRRHHRPVA
jgi:hypothetical protein